MKIEDAKIRIPEKIEQKIKNKLRTSIYTEDYREEYYNIAIDKLEPFKNQARRFFDQQSLESLASTIKEHGIRQPLTVIPSELHEGNYEIISGERRYRAALLIELKVLPCIILRDRRKAEEIAIIENIQREDLHPIELMQAYNSLLEHDICVSMQELANKLGVPKSSVVETINLKKISHKVQDIILQNKIINRDFFRILCKEDEKKQYDLITSYINSNKTSYNKLINKKTRIISLVLSGNELLINENKLNKLSVEQKSNIKVILENLIKNI